MGSLPIAQTVSPYWLNIGEDYREYDEGQQNFSKFYIWGIGEIDKRTGGETLFIEVGVESMPKPQFFFYDYLKSGAQMGFLVWVQDSSPGASFICLAPNK